MTTPPTSAAYSIFRLWMYFLSCLYFSALGLWFIVGRTKQCLDFSLTVHFIHFVISWIYNGHIPHTVSWWILNLVGVTLMTVLGEFLCMRSEIKAIPVGLGPKVDLWSFRKKNNSFIANSWYRLIARVMKNSRMHRSISCWRRQDFIRIFLVRAVRMCYSFPFHVCILLGWSVDFIHDYYFNIPSVRKFDISH